MPIAFAGFHFSYYTFTVSELLKRKRGKDQVRRACNNTAKHILKLSIGGAYVIYSILKSCNIGKHILEFQAEIIIRHVAGVYILL